MANMGYCRFTNTLSDLRDCEEHLDDADGREPGEDEDDAPGFRSDEVSLSSAEARARKRLIALCVSIANNYGHEVEDDVAL